MTPGFFDTGLFGPLAAEKACKHFDQLPIPKFLQNGPVALFVPDIGTAIARRLHEWNPSRRVRRPRREFLAIRFMSSMAGTSMARARSATI